MHLLPLVLLACAPAPPVGDVEVELHPDDPHAAVATVSLDVDAAVHVVYGVAGTFEHATPATELVAGEEVEIDVLGLRADHDYTLSVVAEVGKRTWYSHTEAVRTPPLPSDWPSCEVESDAPEGTFGLDEVVCSSFQLAEQWTWSFGCVDREGHVVFRFPQVDGEDIATVTPLMDGGFAVTSFSADQLTLYDEHGQYVADYQSMWLDGKTRFEHGWLDGHDVIQLSEGPWAGAVVFLTYTWDDWEEWDDGRWGGGLVVLDPYSGEVLWDWTSHGELGDGVPIDPKLDYSRISPVGHEPDWQHMNAMVHGLDDDQGQFFLLSLRHQDWIVKVDVETDAVDWRFGREGDFTLVEDLDDPDSPEVSPDLWFYHQHSPELRSHGDGRASFLVFDNGDFRLDDEGEFVDAPEYSRVVEFELDEESMRAQIVWSFGHEDPQHPDHIFQSGGGDADMLHDGRRVQYSAGGNRGEAHLGEVGYPDGEVLWRLNCQRSESLFRVVSFPSLYERSWWYEVER